MIKAVPVTYSGVRFRSTLEGDWAATLDSLHITWAAEPEGVVLPSGSWYRPDLYLPRLSTFVEVKGPHNQRIGKPHELAAASLHAPGCDTASPSEMHPSGLGGCACGFGPSYPWRLVVIGRPANCGAVTFEAAGCPEHPDPQVVLARCGTCGQYGFTDLSGPWCCRRCHGQGPVQVIPSGRMAFRQVDHRAGQRRRRRKAKAS